MYSQESKILHWSSCSIYPLEVSNLFLFIPPLTHILSCPRHRQTVFYTPSTIIVSEGQKGHRACLLFPQCEEQPRSRYCNIIPNRQRRRDPHTVQNVRYFSPISPLYNIALYVCIWLSFWSADRLSGLD